MAVERLQKYLAGCGVGSRRHCEKLIEAGMVSVNNKVIRDMGVKIDPAKDKVKFNGAEVHLPEEKIFLKMNKPKDCITTAKDPEGRKTVYDLLKNSPGRVFAVGRLDRNTTGLLIFTNDGDLATKLSHPSRKVAKTYKVTIHERLTHKDVDLLEKGIELDDGKTQPAQVTVHENTSSKAVFSIVIAEGRNRQIRRMCEALHHDVKALKRISYGGVNLGNVKPGEFVTLARKEIDLLYNSVKKKA